MSQSSPRAITELKYGWRFVRGNPDRAETEDFDDAAWEGVRVPHDWAITGPSHRAGTRGRVSIVMSAW